MARSPNPKEKEAIKLYKQGMKLKDIADQLELPQGTIRRWKSEHDWDSENEQNKANIRKRKSERSEKKKNIVEKAIEETLDNDELTEKQRLFCVYYVQSFNATQSYINAYNCDYNTANTNGPRLLVNACVREEIRKLKEIKKQTIMLDADDLVEIQMRIAFGNIGDYTMFGRKEKPIWSEDEDGNPVPVIDPDTGKQKIVHYNIVKLKESSMADMRLIKSVKEGKDGISIQIEDRQKAIDWLTKYFELMPADRRKADFDMKKLEMDMLKLELSQKESQQTEIENDGFLECLNDAAGDVWKDENV